MEEARSRNHVPDGPLTYPTGRSGRVHARSTNARAVHAALFRGRTPAHPRDESTHPEAIPEEDWLCGLQIRAHLPRQRRALGFARRGEEVGRAYECLFGEAASARDLAQGAYLWKQALVVGVSWEVRETMFRRSRRSPPCRLREGSLLFLDDGSVQGGHFITWFQSFPKVSPSRSPKDWTRIQHTTESRGDHQPLGVIELPFTRAARAAPHDGPHAACGRRRRRRCKDDG